MLLWLYSVCKKGHSEHRTEKKGWCLCDCCIQTLFLEHAVGFLNLGFSFKPQSPAIEDLRHSVFDFLWSPRAKVLLREINQVSHISVIPQTTTFTFFYLSLAYHTNRKDVKRRCESTLHCFLKRTCYVFNPWPYLDLVLLELSFFSLFLYITEKRLGGFIYFIIRSNPFDWILYLILITLCDWDLKNK